MATYHVLLQLEDKSASRDDGWQAAEAMQLEGVLPVRHKP